MKYITDKTRMITACITTALTVFCFVALFVRPDQTQFLSTGIILIPISANTWLSACMPKDEKPATGKFLRIANVALDFGCLVTILLYTLLAKDIFIWLSLGCSALLCISIAATVVITFNSKNK